MVLDGLKRIEWATRQHAHGSAHDLPNLITSLTAEKSATRKQALSKLTDLIAHQGYAEAVAIDVVPFLIELLGKDTRADHAGILVLLADLSVGGWHGNVAAGATIPQLLQCKAQVELRQVVSQGQSTYEELLSSRKAEIRAAACLCVAMGDWSNETTTFDRIADLVSTEKNGTTLASMLCTLGLAARRIGRSLPNWVTKFDSNRSSLVRATLDIARSFVGGKLAHRDDLIALVTQEKPVRRCAFLNGDLTDIATRILAQDAANSRNIEALRSLVEQTTGTTRTRVARLGLEVLLPPTSEPRVAAELTSEQRSYLSFLDERGIPVWKEDYLRFAIPARRLGRYLAAGERIQPLDRTYADCPLWKHLWATLNGHSLLSDWLEIVKPLSESEIVALCRDAFTPEGYLVYPWPPYFKRTLDEEAQQNDHVYALWVKTLSERCSHDTLHTYLTELSKDFHLSEEALVVAAALAERGGTIADEHDEILKPAMKTIAPQCIRTVLTNLSKDRRTALSSAVDPCLRESLESLGS